MVEVNQLSKSFNGVRILNGVSLKAPCGEVTTIAGPNGIGKTTMLNVICGILYPDAGEVKFGEGESYRDIFTVLSGDKNLYAKNTVKENVQFAAVLRGLRREEIQKNIEKYLSYFPLYETLENKLYEKLSFGQKRLITIFAAAVSGAKIILMDEPTEGLDLEHKKQLADIMAALKKDAAVILTTHDYEFSVNVSDRILFLKDGSIVSENGKLGREEFLKLYHGFYEGGDLQ